MHTGWRQRDSQQVLTAAEPSCSAHGIRNHAERRRQRKCRVVVNTSVRRKFAELVDDLFNVPRRVYLHACMHARQVRSESIQLVRLTQGG
eukprot:6176724-Pleurochrysis_carterae.AAC.1